MTQRRRQLAAGACKSSSRAVRGSVGALIGAAAGALGTWGLATFVGHLQQKNVSAVAHGLPLPIMWSPLVLGIAAGTFVGARHPQC